MADLSTYLTQYGQSVGLPQLSFNDAGICSLTFDNKIVVDICYHADQDQCFFASVIGTIPADHREEFFKQLLISNAYGIENKGAVIGIEEAENRVVLSYTFIPSLFSFELFKTVLGNFVALSEKWQTQYETLLASLGPTQSGGSIPSAFEFTRI